MSISWAVPLTLDPDPNLFGGSGAARETAWTEALADGVAGLAGDQRDRRTRR